MSSKSITKPYQKLRPGHIAFRLLCDHSSGCAIIGNGGSVSKRITRETGVLFLHVDDTLPDSDERIVHVVGPGNLEKTLNLHDEGVRGGERKFQISPAQDALIRAFEIVEANMSEESVRCCRLLTVKGEEKIKVLGNGNGNGNGNGGVSVVAGAVVRVLPMEELPLCAHLSDDLIQITGDSLSVRKALLAVTFCLQGNISRSIIESLSSVSYGAAHVLHEQKHESLDKDGGERGQSRMVVGNKEVVFRLLCPPHAVGGLIGWGGSITKALEKETGARIEASDPVVGCTDRVITVSAMENKEWQNSPAQDAILRIFGSLMEAASELGHASGSSGGESVTARLLIPFSHARMLNIKDIAGAEVQILESHRTYSSVGKKIIQIVGEYSDVHICLLQVTWTLREIIFTSKMNMAPLLPHELYGRTPGVHTPTTMANEMEKFRISCDTNNPLPPTVLSSQSTSGRTLTTFTKNQGDFMASSSSSELGSGDECAVVRNEELEVVVPAHLFSHVYGKGGGNLALLKQISGATIIVHVPFPGTDGKVIIRGTPNQTLAAKSILCAFTMSKHDF